VDAVPRVLFVCTGNICRSPLAEAVLRHRAAAVGLAVEADSAGTSDEEAARPTRAPAGWPSAAASSSPTAGRVRSCAPTSPAST
jgi:hypothetical protein